MTKETDPPVLACMIDAIPKEQRPLHQANMERLMATSIAVWAVSIRR